MYSLLNRANEASIPRLRIVKNNDGYPGKAEDWFCARLLQGVSRLTGLKVYFAWSNGDKCKSEPFLCCENIDIHSTPMVLVRLENKHLTLVKETLIRNFLLRMTCLTFLSLFWLSVPFGMGEIIFCRFVYFIHKLLQIEERLFKVAPYSINHILT